MNRRDRRRDRALERRPNRLPMNPPIGKYADLSADGKTMLDLLFRVLVPRLGGMSEEQHLSACAALSDGGFLWFAKAADEDYTFKMMVAGSPDNKPWVDISPYLGFAQ